MKRDSIAVSSIQFEGDSVAIQYMVKEDIRGKSGSLVRTSVLIIDGSMYDDEIVEMEDHAKTFLMDMLEDFHQAEQWTPPERRDDDDERGMGE